MGGRNIEERGRKWKGMEGREKGWKNMEGYRTHDSWKSWNI